METFTIVLWKPPSRPVQGFSHSGNPTTGEKANATQVWQIESEDGQKVIHVIVIAGGVTKMEAQMYARDHMGDKAHWARIGGDGCKS